MGRNESTGSPEPMGGLDYFKLVMAFFVVSIHTSPLVSWNATADFVLTGILARIAVPFFLMVTGYFVLPGYIFGNERDFRPLFRSIKKILLLYMSATVLYLPVCLYAGQFDGLGIYGVIRLFLFDGTFYHLWYLPAAVTGMLILFFLSRRISWRGVMAISFVLYGIGLAGDSYSGIVITCGGLWKIYDALFQIFSYTRNGIFYTPIFLMMGAWFACRDRKGKGVTLEVVGFLVSLAVMVTEGTVLHFLGGQRHDSMYVFLLPCMFFLYEIALEMPAFSGSKRFREISTWIYVLHPLVIILVRGAAKVIHLEQILVKNSLIHFVIVSALSFFISSWISEWMKKKKRSMRKQDNPKGRAWIEIDRKCLRQNINTLRDYLPEGCRLMAAVKANAYGHGAVLIARELNACGVTSFCVATVYEGKRLRRKGIKGEILVLGYTHPDEFWQLKKYDLIQTVLDVSYAEQLNHYGRKLRVHLKIDTGMHRLGERSENKEELRRIFDLENLDIEGMYTHLCVADSEGLEDRKFTYLQGRAFYEVVSYVEKEGFCPKIHLQASYGLLHYPELSGDYARIGIALYGVLSSREDAERFPVELCPVLSLKARVVMIKELRMGEGAGYGLDYVADRDRKIAVLAIGYADGLPRSLSNGRGYVAINGKKAPIAGRICMDMTLVDVTEIPDVKRGDIAVVIGRSGECEISVYDLAEKENTITNEILSRLGNRLARVIK
ncbi:MAG: serine racemase VanT catalytic subunit [Roseburia sp.]|nr:serine racemase VanT catalytic subunit [Roseburia sp.]